MDDMFAKDIIFDHGGVKIYPKHSIYHQFLGLFNTITVVFYWVYLCLIHVTQPKTRLS